MRIGINLLYLLPGIVGGTETYASGLLSGLSRIVSTEDFLIFVNEQAEDWQLPPGENFRRVVCPVSGLNRFKRFVYEQSILPRLLREYNVDVLHSLGYVSPLLAHCPTIVTIHDLNFRVSGNGMSLIRRMSLELFVRQSAMRARTILTVSEFSRAQILETFKVQAQKVVVTYLGPRPLPGANPSHRRDSEALRYVQSKVPYILAFSSRSRNKNLGQLIRAFALLGERLTHPHQLVLVGHPPSEGGILSVIKSLSLQEKVIWTGYLDDNSLHSLLKGAQMLVFPSFYEGFGLPVLEAMQSGVPVVCSNRASLPEIAGEAALYFDPSSVEDMAEKIARVASSMILQDELRQRGYENVKRFSWVDTAQKTLALYRNAITHPAVEIET